MVESELDVSSFVNIRAELQAQKRETMARVLVVATLFIRGGSIRSLDSFVQIEEFSTQELTDAARQLVNEGHLSIGDDGRCFVPIVSTDDGDRISVELYRMLFNAAFPTRVLDAEFYQQHVNRALLNDICTIQCGLPIRDSDVPEIIKLLRLSPSALAQSLAPMQMIVAARQHDQPNEQVDRFHQNYFRQAALEALKRDFRNSALADFFHESRALRELETTMTLVLKSESGIETEAEFTERIGIARADESLGGGLVHVAKLADAPQPWEHSPQHSSTAEGGHGAAGAESP